MTELLKDKRNERKNHEQINLIKGFFDLFPDCIKSDEPIKGFSNNLKKYSKRKRKPKTVDFLNQFRRAYDTLDRFVDGDQKEQCFRLCLNEVIQNLTDNMKRVPLSVTNIESIEGIGKSSVEHGVAALGRSNNDSKMGIEVSEHFLRHWESEILMWVLTLVSVYHPSYVLK